MANNKEHRANYKVETSFGKCTLGFKKPSGDTQTLAHRASKIIRTPLSSGLNKRWNSLVNAFVEDGNVDGIELMEKKYKELPS